MEADRGCEATVLAAGGAAGARLLASSRPAAHYRRGVQILGFGFLGVFGGYQASQGLQTSLNATLGFINLAALYGTFTLLCLVASPLVGILEAAVALRGVLFLSSLADVAVVLSNVYVANWALPISVNVLAGLAAPLLWTAQNDYVGRCAYYSAQAEDAGAGSAPHADAVAAKTAELNGLFYSTYQISGVAGNVVASCLMLAFSDSPLMKDVLFCVLGSFSAAGSATFLCLPSTGAATSGPERVDLRATAVLMVTDARMAGLIPLIFSNGMMLSFFCGNFSMYVISPVVGPNLVGFVLATSYGVNVVATAVWGRLISRGIVSRRTAYLVSLLCTLAFFVLSMLWHPSANFEKRDGGNWEQTRSPEAVQVVVVFSLAALFAMGDAFLESGIVATLQNYFLGTASVNPAMGGYKMWQSLGYATQFVLGAQLQGNTVIISILTAFSAICLLVLDRRAPLQ